MANFKYLRAYNAYCEECELNHKNPKSYWDWIITA